MFSQRTDWQRQPNRLATLLEERRRRKLPILDLTISNPTNAGFIYPSGILDALRVPGLLRYEPDPAGLPTARQAVAGYYREKVIDVNPSNIILTASTSEAYAFVFMLLCNPGDNILVPAPSYPLFEYLAKLHDVEVGHYDLRYDGSWHVDFQSLNDAIGINTKAIVIVNPHNPTGMFLKNDEAENLRAIAQSNQLALVVDEVFDQYAFAPDPARAGSFAMTGGPLTFTLNGLSKSCGLPQMKLGWMVVSGRESSEALQRLEIIADTFLSAGAPVQLAAASLLEYGKSIRQQIQERTASNFTYLQKAFMHAAGTVLNAEGGWYAIVKLPSVRREEEWVELFLEHDGVYLFPGYFFEMSGGSYVLISLIVRPEGLEEAVTAILTRIE